jgi:hypothetical protein
MTMNRRQPISERESTRFHELFRCNIATAGQEASGIAGLRSMQMKAHPMGWSATGERDRFAYKTPSQTINYRSCPRMSSAGRWCFGVPSLVTCGSLTTA